MKRTTVIIIVLLLSVFLGACKNNNDDDSNAKKVDVYYVDAKTSGLVSENYTLIGTKTNDQIDELLYMLQKAPDNAVYKSALPVDAKVTPSFDDTGYLIIDFDSSYGELEGVADILCRAAIVKTLSQLSKVEYVQLSVEGQPLKDSDGVVGALTEDDFVDNTAANTTYKAKLYFAYNKGEEQKLIEYVTNIEYTGAESIEELVIQQLIKGPDDTGMYRTIPEGTKLLNISKADGICTVDFNENFLYKLPDINEDIAIYSIVNTLVELPDINKVQFTINGKIREDNDIDQTFEAKLDLIENPS